ncbi:MAG: serine/threonine protein kinase [Sandaracinus sp.]|nr:serine/threonine protein kinase [Sandaracinus sp.]
MAARSAPLTFGRYEALFHVASGGMAEVFAARLRGPHGFEKLVAVKRLLPTLTDDSFVTMFLDEARLAANITSPHVVQTLELGRAEDDQALYIVMELVVGVTLFDLCVSLLDELGATPVAAMVELLAQAAMGLHDAHEARTPTGQPLQVVHRDVSPQNLLVGVDGRLRVTDFGIARAVMRSTQTRAGQLKGKVAYLSPEQAAGMSLDRRSDVFALGVVAWEALTGRSLFNTGDAAETVRRVREIRIPGVRELRPEVPESVERVIGWALERDRDLRCPSAQDFATALQEAMPERPGPRELSALVETHGGPSLYRILEQIENVHAGKDATVSRPPPEKSGSRIVPEAEPTQDRILGPSERPPAPSSSSSEVVLPAPPPVGPRQRDLSTHMVTPETMVPSAGVARAPRVRHGKVFLAIGVLAWLSAAGILAWSLSGSRSASDGPVLRETAPP